MPAKPRRKPRTGVTRTTPATDDQQTGEVNVGTQQHLEFYARLNAALDMAPPGHVHISGLTNKQKIRVFSTLQLDHPDVVRALETFQCFIGNSRLDDEDSIIALDIE